jgi:hypothetical protein
MPPLAEGGEIAVVAEQDRAAEVASKQVAQRHSVPPGKVRCTEDHALRRVEWTGCGHTHPQARRVAQLERFDRLDYPTNDRSRTFLGAREDSLAVSWFGLVGGKQRGPDVRSTQINGHDGKHASSITCALAD